MKNNPNGGPKDIYEFIEEYINISNEGYIKSQLKAIGNNEI